MYALKVRKIGGAYGVILPKEALARLKVAEDDKLYLTEAPDGFRLSRQDPEFAKQMETARQVMKDWHPVLRELSK